MCEVSERQAVQMLALCCTGCAQIVGRVVAVGARMRGRGPCSGGVQALRQRSPLLRSPRTLLSRLAGPSRGRRGGLLDLCWLLIMIMTRRGGVQVRQVVIGVGWVSTCGRHGGGAGVRV